MGAFAPAPLVDRATADRIVDTIVRPTIRALRLDGRPYRGVLYAGLMLTADGPKVVEFNCRFGDPECQALMLCLDEDVLPLLEACAQGAPLPPAPRWRDGVAVCVVCASGGYPGEYRTGFPVTGIAEAEAVPGIVVFQAGTARVDGALVTAGGRVLGVTAFGPTMDAAVSSGYEAVGRVNFAGMHFRRDIGRRRARGTPAAVS
jgi:phosphoribosylamine--glycine ligase